MPDPVIQIKRYPNRRYYASGVSRYVSLQDIEQYVHEGATVQIVDSQTGDDITGSVLMQIIAEKHPERMAIFPSAILHSMLRANQVMSNFLEEYFENALRYFEYLEKPGTPASYQQPMQWMNAWMKNLTRKPDANRAPNPPDDSPESPEIAARIAQLERRIAELEGQRHRNDT